MNPILSGGTPAQQGLVRDALASCWIPAEWIMNRFGKFCVNLVDSLPGGNVGFSLRGNIDLLIHDDQYMIQSLCHEFGHQIQYLFSASTNNEWNAMFPPATGYLLEWAKRPKEHFAETTRVCLFPSALSPCTPAARTTLQPIPCADFREFVCAGLCEATDLEGEDRELHAAVGCMAAHGWMLGYKDGTFGPYQPLLRRHVALICERRGIPCLLSTTDYNPALRMNVRDAIPGLSWTEERWDEPITRSQLARLLWRKT